MSRISLALLALGLACAGQPASVTAAPGGYVLYRTEAAPETVLDGLKTAIEERGLYINNVMDMGGMLERTGKDLGAAEPIYTQAHSVEFCSALLSRAMLSEDPARIINCPFIISVYQRSGEAKTTYVAHREIAASEREASPAMQRVAAMLKEIAEAAIAW
jgi:uncharacterized protein (DUF302 family)